MERSAAATEVERDLARYYDQEAAARADRDLDPRRVAARTRLVADVVAAVPGGRILEVGTGPGRDAAALVDAGLDTVGIDLSFEHVHRAAATGASTVVASVRHLPFADGSFDALWSMSTLMHVPATAIADALAELRRVLRPGALAAIGVWGGADVESHHERDAYDPPRLFSRRSDERWRTMLATIGPVEEFETWTDVGDGEYWYQWAVVRRS